jgi:hypothetical protein
MSESRSYEGIGFWGLLGIVFITLKLTGYIDWPWIWVLCPLWIGPAFFLVVLSVAGVCFLLAGLLGMSVEYRKKRLKRRRNFE